MEKHQYTPGLQSKCYGSENHGRLEECTRCAIAAECKTAFMPQSYALEYKDGFSANSTDGISFCDEESDTAGSRKQKPGITPELEELFRETFEKIFSVTGGDPVNIVILLSRLGGASGKEIRKKVRLSSSAVSNRIKSMSLRSPAFGSIFRRRGVRDEMYLSILNGEAIDMRKCDGKPAKTKALNIPKEIFHAYTAPKS